MPNAKSDRPQSGSAEAPAEPGEAKATVKRTAAAAEKGAAKPAAAKPKAGGTDTPASAEAGAGATAGAKIEASAAAGTGDENPLHKKLRLRPEDTGVVIAPPQADDNPLLPLPESFLVLDRAGDLAGHEGLFDYIHVFARDRADLIETFTLLRDRLAPGGSLWISWLKQSSTRRAGSQLGDLNENVIRRLGLTHALVDVKIVALDRDWSALRLVRRKH